MLASVVAPPLFNLQYAARRGPLAALLPVLQYLSGAVVCRSPALMSAS